MGVTEAGFLGGDDEVAGDGELQRTRETEPVDLGHRDRRHRGEQAGDSAGGNVEDVADLAVDELAVTQRLEVHASAEGSTLAGEDNHPDGHVVGELVPGRLPGSRASSV